MPKNISQPLPFPGTGGSEKKKRYRAGSVSVSAEKNGKIEARLDFDLRSKKWKKKSVRVEPGFVAGELRLSYVSRLEKGSKSRGGTRPGLFEPDSSLSLGNSGPKEVYRTFRDHFEPLWQSI